MYDAGSSFPSQTAKLQERLVRETTPQEWANIVAVPKGEVTNPNTLSLCNPWDWVNIHTPLPLQWAG